MRGHARGGIIVSVMPGRERVLLGITIIVAVAVTFFITGVGGFFITRGAGGFVS